MNKNTQNIILKSNAIIDALETMSAKEREAMPTSAFATDYNSLLNLALTEKPDMKNFAPPEVKIQNAMGRIIVSACYVEILSYIKQINALIRD
jgi:hypothetical protein